MIKLKNEINLIIKNELPKLMAGFDPFGLRLIVEEMDKNICWNFVISGRDLKILKQYCINWENVLQKWFYWNVDKYNIIENQLLDLENYGEDILEDLFTGMEINKFNTYLVRLYYLTFDILKNLFEVLPGWLSTGLFKTVKDMANKSIGEKAEETGLIDG